MQHTFSWYMGTQFTNPLSIIVSATGRNRKKIFSLICSILKYERQHVSMLGHLQLLSFMIIFEINWFYFEEKFLVLSTRSESWLQFQKEKKKCRYAYYKCAIWNAPTVSFRIQHRWWWTFSVGYIFLRINTALDFTWNYSGWPFSSLVFQEPLQTKILHSMTVPKQTL